jgi:hypothetical protein
MSAKELVEIDGDIIAEIELAYLFNNGKDHAWILKSQCSWDPDDKKMTMRKSLAKEKDLI